MRIVKNLDYYGKIYYFNFSGESAYKSYLGESNSLFTYACLIGLFFIIGRNVYLRENATLSVSYEKKEKYFDYQINSSSFLFTFGVQDVSRSTSDLSITNLFYFEPRHLTYEINKNGTGTLLEDRLISYKNCTPQDLNSGELDYSAYFCFDNFDKESLRVGGL